MIEPPEHLRQAVLNMFHRGLRLIETQFGRPASPAETEMLQAAIAQYFWAEAQRRPAWSN
jgi:hypothetical protein